MERVQNRSGDQPAGRIEVLPRAVATIAARAALATDGLLGLTPPAAGGDAPALLAPSHAWRGVEVRARGALAVELFVVVRAGAPIAQVAEAARAQVRAALQRALGEAPAAVHIRVQGVRGQA